MGTNMHNISDIPGLMIERFKVTVDEDKGPVEVRGVTDTCSGVQLPPVGDREVVVVL